MIRSVNTEGDQIQISKWDIEGNSIGSVFMPSINGAFGSTNFDRINGDVILKSMQLDTFYKLDEKDLTINSNSFVFVGDIKES